MILFQGVLTQFSMLALNVLAFTQRAFVKYEKKSLSIETWKTYAWVTRMATTTVVHRK